MFQQQLLAQNLFELDRTTEEKEQTITTNA